MYPVPYTAFVDKTETVPLKTVNRQCSSGLQAVADIAAAIKSGFYEIGRILLWFAWFSCFLD